MRFYTLRLMMEQSHPRKRHDNAVFIARLYDVVVADRAAGLGYILHAALPCSLDVVAKREKRVRADRNAALRRYPRLFFPQQSESRALL